MAFKSVIVDGRFWLAAVERSVFTGAQALAASLAVFSAEDISKLHLNGLPWTAMLSVTAVAMILSFLTSVAKAGAVGAPGLAEQLPGPADGYKGAAQEDSSSEAGK